MTEPAQSFHLKRLEKRPEPIEEINDHIAEIIAEGFYSYLLRKGLLKHQDAESLMAHIEELRRSRPDYDAL